MKIFKMLFITTVAMLAFTGCDDSQKEGEYCGNDRAEEGEACDGKDLGGFTCESFGIYGSEGSVKCTDTCEIDMTDCIKPCGNGLIDKDDGEECDGTNIDGKQCSDFGYSGGYLACANDCSFNFEGCFYPECGNGYLEDGEECDGSALGENTCDSLGHEPGSLRCNEDCTLNIEGCGFAFVSISAGYQHTCGILTDGSGWCWGFNGAGQLGDGTHEERTYPVMVSGMEEGIEKISGGREHSCAVKADGSAWCWGKNTSGQLGNGDLEDTMIPAGVSGMSEGVKSICPGADHTCALKSDGSLWCWGSNVSGQIGDGTTEDRHEPVRVESLNYNVISVECGYDHTCVQIDDGSVWCWGSNESGQVGDSTTENRLVPVMVESVGKDITQISVGANHNFAVKNDNSVYGWGMGGFSQLGDGNATNQETPVAISPLENSVQKISAGSIFSCALKLDGTVWCWGFNLFGQLGTGSVDSQSLPVQTQVLTSGVEQLVTGSNHACVLKTDGSVWCWGKNEDGQLSTGDNEDRLIPTPIIP
ncbi:hypothetical protein KKF34_09565 [Myxococcota bacterium]|nr:hypothetical protein [Myxococcota bacterium]MBU1382916.1 hypothetical protein [Myxococcota bacterium]MBU1497111.1 hypothetical protein [Myxococcota bacterium]